MSIVEGRYQHGLRRMIARRVDESGRAATPLELLFDLTFVAAFGVAADQLAQGIIAGQWQMATVAFIFAMLAVVWAWINFCWFASAFDNDDWLFRLMTMVQMTGVVVLAIGLPPLFASLEEGGELDLRVMVAGYVVMRVALILQWFRATNADSRFQLVTLTYGLFVGVAQLGWVLVASLPRSTHAALAAAVALFAIEAAGPVVAERMGALKGEGSTPWHPHHLAERFALLTIIALGETVLGTLASSAEVSAVQGWTVNAVTVVGTGIALAFALWWVYFLVPHAAVLAVRRDKALIWGYAHIVVYAAIAAVGAGLHLIGCIYAPRCSIGATATVAAIGAPVVVFMFVRYLLQSWLVSALPRHSLHQITATALPIVAVGLARVGVPVWACLLVVVSSPVTIILAFEFGGWRTLDAQLARVLKAK